MTLPIIKAGDKFGHLVVIQRVADAKVKSVNLRKRVRVECRGITPTGTVCNKRLTIPDYYLRREGNPKTHCGCQFKSLKTVFFEEYRIWNMMHVRCYDPRHEAYKHYGGRGIHVCPDWHKNAPDGKGFERFLEFIGPRPSPGHSIDRVDNDGSYYPYQADGKTPQVRWATSAEQRANQRPYVYK